MSTPHISATSASERNWLSVRPGPQPKSRTRFPSKDQSAGSRSTIAALVSGPSRQYRPAKASPQLVSTVVAVRKSYGAPAVQRAGSVLSTVGVDWRVMVLLTVTVPPCSRPRPRPSPAASRRGAPLTFRLWFPSSPRPCGPGSHAHGEMSWSPWTGTLRTTRQEIPALVAKLGEGYGVVSGWKQERRDPPVKRWGSTLFNRLKAVGGSPPRPQLRAQGVPGTGRPGARVLR
jgi:hypothetical protein